MLYKLPPFECVESARDVAEDFPGDDLVDTRRSIYCAFSDCLVQGGIACGECMLDRSNDPKDFKTWEAR